MKLSPLNKINIEMKNVLIILAFTAIVAGCNSNANVNPKINQDSIRMAQQLDSFKKAELAEKEKQIAEEAAAAAVAGERANTQAQSASYEPSSPDATTQKKGWSSAAKGAVIGGVVGAGTGVIVDKKDGRGAVIGGVLGAGTGYVIGREKDKKSGRVDQ